MQQYASDSPTIWAQCSVTRVSWCSVFSQPVGSSFLFREYLIFFLWLLNHRVFDKFIQFKGCFKSASCYFYCFNGFTDSQLNNVTMCVNVSKGHVTQSRLDFQKKAYLKGFSKKRAHFQKTLGERAPLPAPCSGGPAQGNIKITKVWIAT